MTRKYSGRWVLGTLLIVGFILGCSAARAADLTDVIPPLHSAELFSSQATGSGLTPYLRTLIAVTLISLVPAGLIAMTSFTRIIITLSFIRHALGLPDTPPTAVLMTLALFMTFFTMAPTFHEVQAEAFTPFMAGKLDLRSAAAAGVKPFKVFMSRHVREQDMELVSTIAHTPIPKRAEDADLTTVVPAFMLSELRAAFSVGFVIFLPFLLIDLIVSAVLMSLGMMMMPPVSISLPLKLMLFVLIDGWTLVVRAIAGAYT